MSTVPTLLRQALAANSLDRMIVVDVETTGLSEHCRVLEIGACFLEVPYTATHKGDRYRARPGRVIPLGAWRPWIAPDRYATLPWEPEALELARASGLLADLEADQGLEVDEFDGPDVVEILGCSLRIPDPELLEKAGNTWATWSGFDHLAILRSAGSSAIASGLFNGAGMYARPPLDLRGLARMARPTLPRDTGLSGAVDALGLGLELERVATTWRVRCEGLEPSRRGRWVPHRALYDATAAALVVLEVLRG